jgi:aminopeptidase YwaD
MMGPVRSIDVDEGAQVIMVPVLPDLLYLTGPETSGRLSGTEGARRASAYLATQLEALGLTPAGDDGFYQWLEVPAARLTGPVRLAVGGVDYRYRRDFGEITHVSSGGILKSTMVVVRDGDEVRPEEIEGRVVLLPKRPEGFDVNATAAAAAEVGASALMVEWGEPKWFHKTLFGSAANRIPVLRIRESLAERLAFAPGVAVELDLPLAVQSRPCRNVLGLIPGADPTRTAALTAHYDHVGDDPDGERFPGAIDNASGVVTVLSVIRRLVEQGLTLPFNLLVGFLTGEESGLWGAKHLASYAPVPLSAVINLDGMGLEPALRAIRLGYPGPGNWLADLAAELFQEHGTEILWTAGHDDSAAFQAAGLPAVGLGHMPRDPLPAGLHSPDDVSAVLHLPAIEEGAEIIVSLIRRLAGYPAWAHESKHLRRS